MASVKFATFVIIFTLVWAGTIIDVSNARVPSHKVPSSVGGWNIIKNLSDPEVIAIAEFAVEEHNHKGNNGPLLKFEKLVKGYYQVVAGLNYRLFLSAQSADQGGDKFGSGMYVAKVFVGLDKSKTLEYFSSYSNDV